MADTTLPGVLLKGVAASRPAASAVAKGTIYSATDTGAITQSDASSWSTYATISSGLADPMTTRGDVIVRNASNTTARLAIGSSGKVLSSDGTDVSWQTPAASGAPDPVLGIFGAATTAYEFATSSFTGLTAMGSPTNEDANTTVPGAYYIRQASGSGTSWKGRYAASPSTPFTAVCEVLDDNARANFNGIGLFVGVTTPGKFETCEVGGTGRIVGPNIYTNPTTYSSTPVAGAWGNFLQPPYYIGVVVNSSTSLDWYVSNNGSIWWPIALAQNPSLTVGSVGLGLNNDNASNATSAAFGFLRFWNTAKTFPGA